MDLVEQGLRHGGVRGSTTGHIQHRRLYTSSHVMMAEVATMEARIATGLEAFFRYSTYSLGLDSLYFSFL